MLLPSKQLQKLRKQACWLAAGLHNAARKLMLDAFHAISRKKGEFALLLVFGGWW
jgi:3-deoxy-D-manno-octulosonic-acid transferase